MKKSLKKFFAAGLTAAMVMSMGMTAMADETPTYKLTTSESQYEAIIKEYTVKGSNDAALYPAETLSFTSEAADTNPDVVANGKKEGYVAKNLTIAPLEVSGNGSTKESVQKLAITVPAFTEVGMYHFTVKETAGNTQGVTYDEATKIAISVLVEYDYADTNKDGNHLKATVGITKASDGTKNEKIINTYDVGSLEVSKTVTGNLGDKEKYFDITVSFTSAQPVKSTITVSGGSNEQNIKEIKETDWSAENTYSTVIKLHDGETVTFADIPVGVAYTVLESDEYSADTDKNGVNGYDAPKYSLNKAEAVEAEAGCSDSVAVDDATTEEVNENVDTVEITNNKNTTIDTGISLDNMPYFMVLALVALGLVGFVSKKRSMEF